jgi:radical SAM-linked protein
VKLRIRHTKLGKVRFTSHRDSATHWERALRKSGVQVAFSNGFTPRPKMSFGLGLPTGAESLAEYVDIDLVDEVDDLDKLATTFTDALPVGYEVTRIVHRPAGLSLQESVVACSWQLHVGEVDAPAVSSAVAAFVAAEHVEMVRERKGKSYTDNVRASVEGLTVASAHGGDVHDGHGAVVVEAMLSTVGRGLRPTELVAALFPGSDPLELTQRVLRLEQFVDREGERVALLDASPVAVAATV